MQHKNSSWLLAFSYQLFLGGDADSTPHQHFRQTARLRMNGRGSTESAKS
jgi:hypothetical protein